MTDALFVLGEYRDPSRPPFIYPLFLEPRSRRDCERAIRWQGMGQPCNTVWHIATHLGNGRFRLEDGSEVAASRGGWTVEAWERLILSPAADGVAK